MIWRHMFSYCMAGSLGALIWVLGVAGAQVSSRPAAPLAVSAPAAAIAAELSRLQRDPADWPMQAGNYAGWRYTPLDQINQTNVKDLKIGWQISTGVLRGHEGGPLVVDGMLYFQTPQPFILYAIDLDRPGEIRWKYNASSDQDAIPMACCDLVNRGPAYADGKLFRTTLDTTSSRSTQRPARRPGRFRTEITRPVKRSPCRPSSWATRSSSATPAENTAFAAP
jgi:glucose dehydrogenase